MNDDRAFQEMEIDGFAHAADVLELGEVLDMIAAECRNDGARRRVRELRPGTDSQQICARVRAVREAREYQQIHGRLPIADTSASSWLRRSRETREIIPPSALLALAAMERSVKDLCGRLRSEDGASGSLDEIAARMAPHDALVGRIERIVDGDGTLKENASPHLHKLRKSIRRAREELRSRSDALARSFGCTEGPTFRDGRFMLVVPREKCRKREGLVHGVSQTGGSLYFEPLSLLERNNALETLESDARDEETRILAELTAEILGIEDSITENVRAVEHLDVLSAAAVFAEGLSCNDAAISDDGSLRVVDARHPLLERSLRVSQPSEGPVPLNLSLEHDRRVLVISGPNAGGKTVALKTVGLAVLLHQCGLPMPCGEGTMLPVFDRVFADIGDEQSIESSLSTFTSHLRHLDRMCRAADANSLCLVDEIGDGTDPDEGAALAVATLETLQSRGAAVVATTHFGKVTAFALKADGVGNAAMLFDAENDRPLYRLLQGTAGRSRGIETAHRVDFCREVVDRARRLVGDEAVRLEELLRELETNRLGIERERAALEAQSARLQALIRSYEQKESRLSADGAARRAAAEKEVEALLLEARREIETLVKKIRETGAERPIVREAHRTIRERLDTVRAAKPARLVGRPRAGEIVSLNPSGSPSGPVVVVHKDAATVEIRGKRFRVPFGALFAATGATQPATTSTAFVGDAPPSADASMDVRGRDREEALEAVDRFLDAAVLNGLHEITVIHGVGEGILRRAIRSHLKRDSRVAAVREGGIGEGGTGVSIVRLR